MNHPQRQLKDWWKGLRVFGRLLLRPQDIPRYLQYGAFTKRTPLDLGMPWWSFGAVDYVGTKLTRDLDVFEFGSGGSTIYVGSRVRSLTCVEDEKEWTQLVTKAVEERKLSAVRVLYRPFDFWKTGNFAESDYLRCLSGKSYDLIIVDGKEWSDPVRDQCFWLAEEHIRPGGFIVLDDSWRYPQLKARNKALRWKDFKGVGYCRVGVTSTCVFEY